MKPFALLSLFLLLATPIFAAHPIKRARWHRRDLGALFDLVNGGLLPSSSDSSGTTSALPPTSVPSSVTPPSTSSSPALLQGLGDLLNPTPSSSSSDPALLPPPSSPTSNVPASTGPSDPGLSLSPVLQPSSTTTDSVSAGPPNADPTTSALSPLVSIPPVAQPSSSPLVSIPSSSDPAVPSSVQQDPPASSSVSVPPVVQPSSAAPLPPVVSAVQPSSVPPDPVPSASVPQPTPSQDPGTSSAPVPLVSAVQPSSVPPDPVSVPPVVQPTPSQDPGTSSAPIPFVSPVVQPSSAPPDPSPLSTPAPPLVSDTSLPPPAVSIPTPVPSTTPPPKTTTTPPTPTPTPQKVSINSDLSFVLTASSLAVADLPTSTNSNGRLDGLGGSTLTDPDAATTTITNTGGPSPSQSSSSSSSSGGLTNNSPLGQQALPNGVPSRIFPPKSEVPEGVTQAEMEKAGYTLISLLFDQQLNWWFVVNSQLASSQLFAFVPPILATALGVPTDQVKTLFLQVLIPSSYTSPDDKLQLQTLWMGYIPTEDVDTLAAMIKARQSKFYTGVDIPAARQLAERVVSGWSIKGTVGTSSDGSTTGGAGGTGSTGVGASKGEADEEKTRRDAIIGVVCSLGSIALVVLGFLVVHSVKRRREAAHRRLEDRPSSMSGSTSSDPVRGRGGGPSVGVVSGGREFDRDSVGAPRRRSFYFAEDSLRGYEAEMISRRGDSPNGGGGPIAVPIPAPATMMSQRKVGPVVVPGTTISAPILTESSMNW